MSVVEYHVVLSFVMLSLASKYPLKNQKVHLAKIMFKIFHAQARGSKCNHDDIKREQYAIV